LRAFSLCFSRLSTSVTWICQQFFSGAQKYTLSHTYRFGHTVSIAANSLMYQNKKRTKKLCVSWVGTPETVRGALPSLWLEAGRRLSEAVILVRSWAMAVGPEMELISAGIPHALGDWDKSYTSALS